MSYQNLKQECASAPRFRWLTGMLTESGESGLVKKDDMPRLSDPATLGAIAILAAEAHLAAYIGFEIVRGTQLGGELEWFAMSAKGKQIAGGRSTFDREPFAHAVVRALVAAPDCRLCRDTGLVRDVPCKVCKLGRQKALELMQRRREESGATVHEALREANILLGNAREELEDVKQMLDDVKAERDSIRDDARKLRALLNECEEARELWRLSNERKPCEWCDGVGLVQDGGPCLACEGTGTWP